MNVKVVGPDVPGPSSAELRRLFRGRRLTAARRERLSSAGRVVAHNAGRVVGLAAYERLESEVRAHEFGVDDEAPCGAAAIVATLLDALEIACLAGGCRRLVVNAHAIADDRPLTDRGFLTVGAPASPRSFVKTFPI